MGGRRNRGGATAPPGERPAPLVSTSSSDATLEEDLLCNVQNETRARHRAQALHESSSTGTGDPALSEQQFLPRTRPESAAVKQAALPEVAAADAQEEAAFPEMEQSMTALIDLPHKKADQLRGGVMDDPAILASGYSVHQSYQQILLPIFITADILSPPLVPPSEEQIQDIPEKDRSKKNLNFLLYVAVRIAIVVLSNHIMLLWLQSFNQSQQQRFISQRTNCRPMEVAVKWSHDDDNGIPFPLYAEFCGDTSSSSQRREWNDVRIVRKLRGLHQQEKVAAHNHFRELRDSWGANRRKASSLFMLTVDKLRDEKPKEECKKVCGIPDYLVCPLSGNLMVDPVTIATEKTFDRRFLKKWFEKNGHICPLTGELISGTILRNERVRGYLQVWEESKVEWLSKCRK
ncbi:unnamed protein product [Alopecurus aequalis]